jgi:serine/threonine protein kinase/Tol biopolymer transport system component
MHVATGTRLGPYEVVGPIGSGGMGEVWEARDTRLGRAVAIKVLPAELAQNAQLKVRFDREAKTISQLNHPHICTLYDVGDGYLVMELLEGESLAERIAKGPLPVVEVLRLGAQIAEALDRAHRAGVVHRDLKPANVMLTKSGAKLLDFGLSKSDAAGPLQIDGATQQKSLTQEGTILGTFQYMAPEQLEGLEADARTDIFALGALLYEMATGKRAFQGTSKTSLIAAIVTAEPQPISAIQPLTPPAFEHVIKKCLAKDREARWQSAYDVAEELRWIGEAGSQAGVASPILVSKRQRQRNLWLLAMIAVASLAAAAGWVASSLWKSTHDRQPVYRLTIPTPPGSVLGYAQGRMALSPDGQRLAFATYGRLGNALLVRELRETTWRPLEGTSGAVSPFWSPDARQIAYFARGSLWKIGADGSAAPEEVTRIAGGGRGPSGTWNREGTILFANGGKLFKVNASGGDPVELVKGKSLGPVQDPDFLADGQHFIASSIGKAGRNIHFVGSLDPNQEPRPLVNGNNNALYCDGYLFYVRSGTLYAQRFDEKKLTLSGESKAVTKVLGFDPEPAYFAVAGDALVYLPQGSEVRTELQRVDRTGKAIATIGQPAFYFSPRVSHDGTRIAADQSGTNGSGDIWIINVANGGATRLTFAPENESGPVWAPDDSEVSYFMNSDTTYVVMRKRIAGGQPSLAYQGPAVSVVSDWSHDNKWLLVLSTPAFDAPLQVVPLAMPELKPAPAVAAGRAAHFSPDGRWVAYATTDSDGGGQEIFVQPFPPNGSKWQISSEGGAMPVWARDGKSLFYLSVSGQMMQVAVGSSADGSFVSQVPQALFPVALREGGAMFSQYDVFPDGTFLLNRIPDSATTPMTVIINWKETLATN